MVGVIESVAAILGLVIPPTYDFIKKKFLKPGSDTPEATLSNLATTKPEAMGDYLKGYADLMRAQVEFFNRDVSGSPSTWVVNTRAIIRPALTILCVGILIASIWVPVDPNTRAAAWTTVGSWMGSRIS